MNRLLKIICCQTGIIIRRGPKFFFLLLRKEIQRRMPYYRTHEVRKSSGTDMPDKTFYVIGVDEGWAGLFAIVIHQLVHIIYAVERGYIPIVDLQHHYSQYLVLNELFKENAWEYFFEQPAEYSLNDIRSAKNIIKSVQNAHPPAQQWFLSYRNTFGNLKDFSCPKEIFTKYIRLNEKTKDFVTKKQNELLKNRGKILGIHCRGTDYTQLKPKGHPIQPAPEEVIKKAEEVMAQHHCDSLYLATEDADIYDLFVAHFGDKLIYDPISRWRNADLPKGRSNSKRLSYNDKPGKIQGGVEYLSQVYLLSRCTCFIGGATYGTLGALLMNDSFDYVHVFNKGFYP
jgi:hypothetical protein